MADYRRIEAGLSDSRKFFSSPLWLRWAPGFTYPVSVTSGSDPGVQQPGRVANHSASSRV